MNSKPTVESVMQEVLEAGSPQLWTMRNLNAVMAGRITQDEFQVKVELLKEGTRIWQEARSKPPASSRRLTAEEIEQAQALLPRELDMNRPFMDQFEEAADKDPTGLIWRWIRDEVYSNPDLIATLRSPVGKVC